MNSQTKDPICGILRELRNRAGLSLQRVEEKTGGRWKSVVVGSYERGDRRPTVDRVRELLDLYGGYRLEVVAPDEHVMSARAEKDRWLEWFVLAGPETIACDDEAEARRIASRIPGAVVANRTHTVSDITPADQEPEP